MQGEGGEVWAEGLGWGGGGGCVDGGVDEGGGGAVVMLAAMAAGATAVMTAAKVGVEEVTTATTAHVYGSCAHTPCCPQYPLWY